MQIAEHLAALEGEGELLAVAAERSAPDTPIPTCPDWRMRDLVHHIGMVHRWATTHVAERRTEDFDADEVVGPYPDDAHLVSWFREGHQRLLRALRSAPDDLACWTFLPAPSPRAFWARRQAHETAIHRVDAESPGGTITAFPPSSPRTASRSCSSDSSPGGARSRDPRCCGPCTCMPPTRTGNGC